MKISKKVDFMAEGLINKRQAQLIASLMFIVVGIFYLFEDLMGGLILTIIGIGISNQMQGWIQTGLKISLPYIKRLFGENDSEKITQKTNNPKDSITVQTQGGIKAGRDINIHNVIKSNKKKRG